MIRFMARRQRNCSSTNVEDVRTLLKREDIYKKYFGS